MSRWGRGIKIKLNHPGTKVFKSTYYDLMGNEGFVRPNTFTDNLKTKSGRLDQSRRKKNASTSKMEENRTNGRLSHDEDKHGEIGEAIKKVRRKKGKKNK